MASGLAVAARGLGACQRPLRLKGELPQQGGPICKRYGWTLPNGGIVTNAPESGRSVQASGAMGDGRVVEQTAEDSAGLGEMGEGEGRDVRGAGRCDNGQDNCRNPRPWQRVAGGVRCG